MDAGKFTFPAQRRCVDGENAQSSQGERGRRGEEETLERIIQAIETSDNVSGGSPNHSEIAVNLTTLLRNHLEDSDCRVLNSDARIKIQASEKYTYPDVSVTCDEGDRDTTQFINHPCLITCIDLY